MKSYKFQIGDKVTHGLPYLEGQIGIVLDLVKKGTNEYVLVKWPKYSDLDHAPSILKLYKNGVDKLEEIL